MGMSIDESGHDGLAGDVDRLRARRRLKAAARAHGGDAVVAYEHVAALDDLVALHRHDACASEQRAGLRDVAPPLEQDLRLDGLIATRIGRRTLRPILRRIALQIRSRSLLRSDRVIHLTRTID